jgi:hypothetical protein
MAAVAGEMRLQSDHLVCCVSYASKPYLTFTIDSPRFRNELCLAIFRRQVPVHRS